MNAPLDIVVLGLTLSSSWGNGHATTYRALLRGLAAAGHRVSFLERDVPWYARHRDLAEPDFCTLHYYDSVDDLDGCYRPLLEKADTVVVGSYVPEGARVIDRLEGFALGSFCFYDIDTPVTLARLARGDGEFIRRSQVPLFDLYFSFSGGAVLDRLEREFGARKAVALYCSVDERAYFNSGGTPLWDLGYLGTYSEDRQPALERLLIEPARRLPARRFVVAGAQYPPSIAWPGNVERIDHLPPGRHARFYARQRFTLNVTRSDMVKAGWSPSVRLFEAGACATPVISDRWPGLTDLFAENEAILIAETSEAVASLLESFPEGERLKIGREARRRVLGRHTGRARAREFTDAIRTLRSTAPALAL